MASTPEPSGRAGSSRRSTLWMVRHARVDVAPGTCYGSTDLAAPVEGTKACAQELALDLPKGSRVVASPLQRCQSLMAALQTLRDDCRFETDPKLAEMHFGAWEMQTWEAIGERAVTQWTQDFLHHAPGGGETTQKLLVRVGLAMHEALNAQFDEPFAEPIADEAGQHLTETRANSYSGVDRPLEHPQFAQPVTLWITHAGTMRAALALHRGLLQPKASDWPQDPIGYGQIARLELST